MLFVGAGLKGGEGARADQVQVCGADAERTRRGCIILESTREVTAAQRLRRDGDGAEQGREHVGVGGPAGEQMGIVVAGSAALEITPAVRGITHWNRFRWFVL